ncbi:MAG: HAMP domain-containing protein, partial [Alphaproteobacteria bacterium]|nr:HAMP domain-containing protein [Alphaproteobacteria bacterium]
MRLRALLALVFGATGLLTILLLGNSLLKQRDALRLIEAQRQRFVSEQLADELRQSSDDLTRMARTYAVTGDEKFMRFFDQIQAIRSGEAPRPIGYEAVYWDLVLNPADHEASAKAAASALQSRMIDAGFSVQEFALLQKAEKESEALIALERIAMNAVRGRFDDGTGVFAIVKPPDREMAVRLLHGEQYHVAKANIMAPIKEFTAGATGRMRTLTAGLEADMQRRLEISSALLVAILVVLVAGYVATIRLVLRPVRALSDAALRLQRGEWVEIAAAGGTRELGALVDTFNRMSSAL